MPKRSQPNLHCYFDPATGRFTQRDPIGFAGGVNPYAYAGNNPINFNDPSGLFPHGPSNSNQPSYPSESFFTGESYHVAFGPAAMTALGGGGLGLGGSIGAGGYQPYNGTSGTPPLVGQYQTPLVYDGGRYNGDRGYVYSGRPTDRPDRWATPATVSPAINPTAGSNVYNSRGTNLQGGKYGDLSADGLHRHHMPSAQASPLSKNDGPAIQMDPADHRRTASYGGGTNSPQQLYRDQQSALISQGKFDDAFLMDVLDIQSKFGNQYDQAILEAIDALPK